jgi:hypothetical protein
MRTVPLAAALAFSLAVPAGAAAHERGGLDLDVDGCSIDGDGGDRLARRGDLVIAAGDRVKDAIALQGKVVVKAGASVDDVIAIGGDVVVEAGAVVRGSAVAVDGDVRVARGARVDEDAFSLGGAVRVARGGTVWGDTGTLSASWGGTALAKAIADEIAEECGGAQASAVERDAP